MEPRQRFKVAVTAPMEIGAGRGNKADFGFGIVHLFKERNAIPMDLKRSRQAKAAGAFREFSCQVYEDGFRLPGGCACGAA